MKRNKKHKRGSYMIVSPDGLKRKTIKNQEKINRDLRDYNYLENRNRV